MQYIIDGYNYIHQIPSLRKFRKKAVSMLVKKISSFCDYCQASVTLVFDGTPVENIYHDLYQSVDVKFSGKRFSADALIEKIVIEDNNRNQMCVVTADRKIRALKGVLSMSPQSFEMEMRSRIKMLKRELAHRLRNR